MNSLRRLLIVASVAVFFHNTVHAQTIVADSLEMALELTQDNTEKIELLLRLSDEFENKNPDKALAYSKKAFSLAQTNNKEQLKLKAMLSMAQLYCSLSDFKAAMDLARKSVELAKELDNQKELAKAYRLVGLVYSDLGDYNESSENYYKSLEISERINDREGTEKALRRIASVYFDQKNYDKALEYYFQALNIAKAIKDLPGIAGGYNDIAAVYGNRKQYDKVVKYLKEAVKINKDLGDERSVAINYTNLGMINQRMENYDTALIYYQKAYKIFKKLNHAMMIANCEVIMAAYFFETGHTDMCIEYAKRAYDSGRKHGLKKVVYDAAGVLYSGYLARADSLTANQYLIKQYQMKDSLEMEKGAMQLSKLEIRYAFEKEKQAEKIEQQRKDFILIIIIITLVLGLGIIILFFARQKIKARNTELEKLNLEKELEYKNKELAIKVMSLLKKNEMLSEISRKLIDVKNEAVKDDTKEAIRRIYRDLQKSTDDEIWEEFELRFKQVHSEFYDKLMKRFPDLSPSEQRLCAFLRLNMSSKEISELTGQSLNALETARYRLRKKLGISNSQVNLITFLSQI
jgi:tetratricopeptide (TPR) repeat protein/DNA-binding CsgD family transcriptional regulator